MSSPEVLPSRPGSSLAFHSDFKTLQGLHSPSRAFLSLPVPATSPSDIASTWLRSLSSAILAYSPDGLGACFASDCHWRDLLALSWDIRTISGQANVVLYLVEWILQVHPRCFRLEPGAEHNAPYDGLEYVSGSATFETDDGMCSMRFNLVSTAKGWKAWTVVSLLDALKARSGDDRSSAPAAQGDRPAVVIIGAGQCGLAVAARLAHMGVDSVIIERNARVGDNWRHRYASLRLNTPTKHSELPSMSYPTSWDRWPSGRALADEMEDYPRKLGLAVWTSSTLLSANYISSSKTWNILIQTPDEGIRPLAPRHLIVATGIGTLSGFTPRVPRLPGQDGFSGRILHSSQYRSSEEWKGKSVIVVGAACSGHDIAQDLYNHGAIVTMIQRSPTAVISRERLWMLFQGEKLYGEKTTLQTDIADRLVQSTPTAVSVTMLHPIEQKLRSIDRELFASLQSRGFLIPEENDSFLHRILVRRGGYYVDGGASKLIIDGKESPAFIAIKSSVQPAGFNESQLLLSDGSALPADLVVFATGYAKNDLREYTRFLLGQDVAQHVTATGSWDEEREISGVWRPTGHDGLWFAGGDLFAARFYSQLLAFQIKSREDGVRA